MTVYLEHLECSTCRKRTVHLRRGLNHAFHLLGALATAGIWCVGWLLMAMSQDRTSYCIHCDSAQYTEAPFGWGYQRTKDKLRAAEAERVSGSTADEGSAR